MNKWKLWIVELSNNTYVTRIGHWVVSNFWLMKIFHDFGPKWTVKESMPMLECWGSDTVLEMNWKVWSIIMLCSLVFATLYIYIYIYGRLKMSHVKLWTWRTRMWVSMLEIDFGAGSSVIVCVSLFVCSCEQTVALKCLKKEKVHEWKHFPAIALHITLFKGSQTK